jgi:hypothetical protein
MDVGKPTILAALRKNSVLNATMSPTGWKAESLQIVGIQAAVKAWLEWRGIKTLSNQS